MALGGIDPSRDVLYNATDVIFPSYFFVFARSPSDYRLKSFSDLKGMRIGYKRAARPAKNLLEKLPSTILKPYDDHESLTKALLSKEIDVIVAYMSYDHWRKQNLQGTIDNILLIDLKGKRVSTPRNHRGAEMFLDQIGGVKRVLTDTPLEQMQQVISCEVDALIGYFTYMIHSKLRGQRYANDMEDTFINRNCFVSDGFSGLG